MSLNADAVPAGLASPVLRSPKGPAVCSLERPAADILVLGPARASGWPSRSNMSLAGWLVAWGTLGFIIVAGALQLLLILGLALTLPFYWAWSAWTDGAWGQLSCALLLEGGVIALLVLAVLALASTGRWVTFDRCQGLLTISRRPFGWRRSPRVLESRPLQEVAAVQLVYGGVATETEPPDPYGGMSPLIERRYDWYEFNLVLRGPDKRRLNLASGRDWMWMRQAGHEVAEFLGVPLTDQLYHGP